MTSLQTNQDTLSPTQAKSKTVVNKYLNKQKALQELLQPSQNRAVSQLNEKLNLSQCAMKMLETVLKNSNVSAVPQTSDDYQQLLKKVREDRHLFQTNVARIIRSLSDQLQYDSKLQQLVVKHLGFQQETRIFHNEEAHSIINQGESYQQDQDIGYVQLGSFLEKFAKQFEIPSLQDQKSLKTLMGSQESSFISPQCSQQFLNEAKQLEIMQITSVFDDPNSKYLQSKQEIFDTTQGKWVEQRSQKTNQNHNEEFDDCSELIANENIESIQNQQNILPNYHTQFLSQNQNKNRYPYHSYSGLMEIISNINKKQYQINQQKNQPQMQQQNQTKMAQSEQIIEQQKNSDHFNYQQSSQTQQYHQQSNEIQADFNKNSLDFQPLQQYKLFQSNSLLSANNSIMNTPINIKDNQNYQYHNGSSYSTFKSKSSAKLLFGQMNSNSSPKYNSTLINNIQTKEFTNQRNLFNSEVKQHQQSSPLIYKPVLGQKLKSHCSIESLEKNVIKQQQQQQQNDIFTTPVNKRLKSEKIYSSGFRNNSSALDDLEDNSSSDSEDEKMEGEVNDNVSSASRKKRGLKILSVKVQELVFKKQQTTYKDVANELIKQLRDNKKKIQDFDGIDNDDSAENFGDEDYLSDESPNKRGDQTSTSQQKWEKNVRRRVYDALNVLYAAGVLKKDGKHVSCDNKVLQLTNKMKDTTTQSASQNSKQITQRSHVQDAKIMQKIEEMRYKIINAEQRVEQKRDILFDQYKHYLSYKQLIHRNKQRGYYEAQKSVSLPFILVSTKDCPENEVEISFGEQNKSLNIAMKKPMKCIGDADSLVKLGMYKVNSDWLEQNIPDSYGYPILSQLNDKQRKEILIQ